jgi:phosphate transport system substrate-binding protein
MKVIRILTAVFAAFAASVVSAQQINGAGATFPYPIDSKWFAEYNKLHPNVQINYQSIGSGGGIRQLTAQTVFFGATDGPMTNDQIFAAPGRILHLPTVLGGDVPVYNLPGDPDLKFTGSVLADIFLGKIVKWNDPALARLNPGVNLPNMDITVAHRSDGSGTTYIFVDYLAKVSPEWKQKVGVATSVNWPVGIGGKGNEGVAGLVKQTPGAIGYVELIYALQAASGKAMPADFRVSITNAPGHNVYPISSFTWLLFYENPKDKQRARVMNDFMKWALTAGQKFVPELGVKL